MISSHRQKVYRITLHSAPGACNTNIVPVHLGFSELIYEIIF